MPRGTSALSSHKFLFSQYRGPHIYNVADPASPPPPAPVPEPSPTPAPAKDETEGRISELAKKNKDLEKQLKDREAADKKAEEDRLAKSGEHETLAKTREQERDAAAKERDDAKAAVTEYEEIATGTIKSALDSITDAEKKKSVEAMLEGLSVRDQYKKLPDLMKLVGGTAPAFGGTTPASTKTPDKTTDEQKRARFNELLTKKTREGLTPQEDAERKKLANELSSFFKS